MLKMTDRESFESAIGEVEREAAKYVDDPGVRGVLARVGIAAGRPLSLALLDELDRESQIADVMQAISSITANMAAMILSATGAKRDPKIALDSARALGSMIERDLRYRLENPHLAIAIRRPDVKGSG